VQPVPIWAPEAGAMANYPGVTTFLSSYPTARIVRLFGEVEASARIPYLLFAAGLFAGLVRTIEIGRLDRARPEYPWLVTAGLAVFTVVMAFSATYNPYHADLGLPATQDALVIAWFLGFAASFVASQPLGIAGFGLLTYFTSPAGTILLGLWVLGAALLLRPFPRRALLVAAGTVAVGVAAGRAAPALLAALGLPRPGTEHAAGGLMERLLRIDGRDWRRLAFLVIPGGILPALSLLAWRRMDGVARTLAAVALAQFAFFYVQRRSSLHYYAPAMVLPIAICWRTLPEIWKGRLLPIGGALAAAAALLVSLPGNARPHLGARAVGAGIVDRRSGYDAVEASAFRRSELLSEIFPRDSHRSVPDSSYGGSPLSWLYYAHRGNPGDPAYVLQDEADPPPPGGRLVASKHGVALYVVDEAILRRDRGRVLPPSIARVYRLSKRTLFTG
jgi:hypothetical protein